MTKILVFVVTLVSFITATGQTPVPQPTPNREAERQRQLREIEQRRQTELGFQRLRAISEQFYKGKPVPRLVLSDMKELYRDPTGKELKKLQSLNEDIQKYSTFLRQRKTGLTRLEPYSGCGDSTKVISSADACLEYSLPGNGSDYSFREGNYKLGRLADLRFGNDVFSSPGVLQQAVFVGLGDIPLDQVNLNTAGMAYLVNFKPVSQLAAAVAFGREFQNGTETGGYFYAGELRAVENMTYVLRSIAYRGSFVRSIGGFAFNEIDFDRRGDITVAFRVIRKHDNGAVTILWRELERKEAPKLLKDKSLPASTGNKPFAARGN